MAGAAAGGAGAYFLRRYIQHTRNVAAARQLLFRFAESHDLVPLGLVSLSYLAPRNDLSTLVRDLEQRLHVSFSSLDYDAAALAIQAAIDDDFDRGDLMEIEGWLLPYTTALLAAAAARMGTKFSETPVHV
jgi:hypothetical protein